MIRKQAISKGTNGEGISIPVIHCSKKDKGVKPITNLKRLSAFVVTVHFKMEGMHSLRDILRRGDYMTN